MSSLQKDDQVAFYHREVDSIIYGKIESIFTNCTKKYRIEYRNHKNNLFVFAVEAEDIICSGRAAEVLYG